jgi:putative SOS response-associated peptidase YedK
VDTILTLLSPVSKVGRQAAHEVGKSDSVEFARNRRLKFQLRRGHRLSFAAITDEPPAEVAAAGHDRCIIPIKPENIDAWLNPDLARRAALYAILDDRQRPYYGHRLAA